MRQNPNPNQNRNSADKKEQFAVRLSEERARTIRRHMRMHETTKADALRAAVDALDVGHKTPTADASRTESRDAVATAAADTDLPPDVRDLVDDSDEATLDP